MEHNHITIINCKHVAIRVRWVIIESIIYVKRVIQHVLHVQIKAVFHISVALITDLILIILQIFISVQIIVEKAIIIINIIVNYVIHRAILAKINLINLVP